MNYNIKIDILLVVIVILFFSLRMFLILMHVMDSHFLLLSIYFSHFQKGLLEIVFVFEHVVLLVVGVVAVVAFVLVVLCEVSSLFVVVLGFDHCDVGIVYFKMYYTII